MVHKVEVAVELDMLCFRDLDRRMALGTRTEAFELGNHVAFLELAVGYQLTGKVFDRTLAVDMELAWVGGLLLMVAGSDGFRILILSNSHNKDKLDVEKEAVREDCEKCRRFVFYRTSLGFSLEVWGFVPFSSSEFACVITIGVTQTGFCEALCTQS